MMIHNTRLKFPNPSSFQRGNEQRRWSSLLDSLGSARCSGWGSSTLVVRRKDEWEKYMSLCLSLRRIREDSNRLYRRAMLKVVAKHLGQVVLRRRRRCHLHLHSDSGSTSRHQRLCLADVVADAVAGADYSGEDDLRVDAECGEAGDAVACPSSLL
jgi:hypothetical protein